MPQKVDVLICGSGSAGLCAALWLSRYNIPCTIVDSRPGPMKIGQADGVQCRTVEVFDSFNIAEELLREAYHCVENAFWAADEREDGGIVRTKRTADTAPGLSHQPHVILNQARVNGLMIEAMRSGSGQEVSYGYAVEIVDVDSATVSNEDAYPVTVCTRRDGQEEVFHAKYVLGCDGAHSAVRRSLDIKMVGDSQQSVWGVSDIYPRTNFPDIRRKCIIHSRAGSLIIIPREGGSLARFYIQLPPGTVAKEVQLQHLYDAAKKIFAPYEMDFAGCYWWSAYSIGQRLADRFSKDNRVFLLGDACHTHSPKAGQGMNTSLQDGYNIGWKLASIIRGQAPSSILHTYDLERGKVAADLIAFDRQMTQMLAEEKKDDSGDGGREDKSQKFTDMFLKAARYTAGLTATYDDSPITNATRSRKGLAKGLDVGMRLPTAQVVKWCDSKPIQLVKALPADGRWRILIFGGNLHDATSLPRISKLAAYLASETGPIKTYTPASEDIDSFIETLVVFSGKRTEVELEQIPSFFTPISGQWRMRDLHKVFFDDESYNLGHGKAYEFFGVNEREGAVIIVRPDQYISMVTALDDHKGIGGFFAGFALPRT